MHSDLFRLSGKETCATSSWTLREADCPCRAARERARERREAATCTASWSPESALAPSSLPGENGSFEIEIEMKESVKTYAAGRNPGTCPCSFWGASPTCTRTRRGFPFLCESWSCHTVQVIHRDLKPVGHSREHFAPAPPSNFPQTQLLKENVLIVRKGLRRHLKHVLERVGSQGCRTQVPSADQSRFVLKCFQLSRS